MPTVLSVGGVVRFDVAFVEQLLTKLAARRPAGPSFCLLVRSPTASGATEQALFVDLAAGTVARGAREEAGVTLRLSPADLEATLQGRVSAEDFVRRVDVDLAPPSTLAALLTALRPTAEAAQTGAREVAGEAQERRYAGVGGDGMIDEEGRRVKGRPQAFVVKVTAPATPSGSAFGASRAGGDAHSFALANLVRVLEPLAAFASEQQASALRVLGGMASVQDGDGWQELGRLGD